MKHPKDTAIRRNGPSAPLKYLLRTGAFCAADRPASCKLPTDWPKVLDYGCGHGADVEYLRSLGYNVRGFDYYWRDDFDALLQRYDVVLCTYVLNVIVDDVVRAKTLEQVRDLTTPGGVAFVTVRRDLAADTESQRRVFLDFPSLVVGTGFETYSIQRPA